MKRGIKRSNRKKTSSFGQTLQNQDQFFGINSPFGKKCMTYYLRTCVYKPHSAHINAAHTPKPTNHITPLLLLIFFKIIFNDPPPRNLHQPTHFKHHLTNIHHLTAPPLLFLFPTESSALSYLSTEYYYLHCTNFPLLRWYFATSPAYVPVGEPRMPCHVMYDMRSKLMRTAHQIASVPLLQLVCT